jgi:hypothetical protein
MAAGTENVRCAVRNVPSLLAGHVVPPVAAAFSGQLAFADQNGPFAAASDGVFPALALIASASLLKIPLLHPDVA